MTEKNTGREIGGNNGLRRIAYLSPLAVIALSFGYAVGWGSFVLPGTMFLPKAGPAGTIIGLLAGTAAIIALAYNYHKLTVSIGGSGGAYGFVSNLFGYNHGFLVGWFLLLTYVAILWANASALILLARYLSGNAFQFGFHYTMVGFDVYFGEILLSIAAIVLCGGACCLSKRLAIRLHTFCAFMLVIGVTVCFLAALYRHEGGAAAMAPAFASENPKWVQILRILAMVPWAFVGFEAVVHSAPEFRFPVRRTFSLLLTAILLSALMYVLLVLLPVLGLPDGYANWEAYIEALPDLNGIDAMPVFSAANKVLGSLGVAVIGGSMLAAQLTALFATYIAVSRLMHAMSEDNMFPKWLGKCNCDGTPVNAVLAVMLISIPIPFLGRTVIGWPVDLSNLGAAVAYGYTSASVLALLKKDGEKAHFAEKISGVFGVGMAMIFTLLTLVPNYLSGSSLTTESYLLLAIWCFIGFVVYRRVFIMDSHGLMGKSIVVWITVLIVIFFSSLMWFRLAVCDSAENAFRDLVGHTVTEESAEQCIRYVNADMLLKSIVELSVLVSTFAIILNLLSILRKREKSLIVEKLHAEESANRSKSYFFSTISHDIRTPLNAIIGYSQMLRMGFQKEEERQQAVDSIIRSGDTLLRLINDALDFAKLEDGCLEIEKKPVDCSRLLLTFTDSFRQARQPKHVELRCCPGKMPVLLIDPKRLRQILFNLTDNAVKFTKQGFVEIRSSFTEDGDSRTGTLRFEVEDSGCGISKKDLERIVTPYVQVDAEHARHGGTGLGLAVCRSLTEAMNGELSIVSELKKGSTFTIAFSHVQITDAAPVEEEESTPAPAKAASPKIPAATEPATAEKLEGSPGRIQRILIADDQKMNLAVLKAMLKKLGTFDIVTAMNGKEALDAVTSSDSPFSLILTDMWMPVMDGEELVHALRADARFAQIPIHVVTADTEMQERYREAGFDGIILKPITVDKLRTLIF